MYVAKSMTVTNVLQNHRILRFVVYYRDNRIIPTVASRQRRIWLSDSYYSTQVYYRTKSITVPSLLLHPSLLPYQVYYRTKSITAPKSITLPLLLPYQVYYCTQVYYLTNSITAQIPLLHPSIFPVPYTHLRTHEYKAKLVCRLLL